MRTDHNGLNWWPYEHNNDGVSDALPWNYTRVTDLAYWCAGSAWESVLCGQYYRNSTTVVRFTPGANG